MVIRLLLLITVLGALSGCASVKEFLAGIEARLVSPTGADEAFSMTYEDIMDTRTVRAAAGDGYRWIPPVVQKVKVPAMIRGGVLIPTHETYVIVNDAAYVMDDEKSEAVRRKYSIPSGIEIVSPMKGSDVVVGVFRMNKVFADSAVVAISKVSFLLQGKRLDRALALFNDEVAQLGTYLCSFNRERGDDFVTVSVVESSLKSIKTYTLSKTQMLFLSNGYVLAPLFEKSRQKETRND